MIPKKFLDATDLSKAQIFSILEMTKVVVIYEHKDLVLATL